MATVRFYISPIIGSGTEADPYRPKAADYGLPWSAQMDNDPVTGAPLQTKSVVRVEAEDFSALDADADLRNVTNVAA